MTTLKKIASLTVLLIAAAMLSRCTPAPSRMITETIYSEALGEERTCCVYLPENFDPDQTYPVVFATDGQVLLDGGYDTLLDELIEKGTIPPVVLIGAYSNENTVSDGMDLRYYEYIDSDDATSRSDADAAGGASADPRIAGRFHHHLSYFTSELRDSIFTEYAIRPDTQKILFYGCSNGGDYGLTLYTTQPGELFTDYICLSPVGTDSDAISCAGTALLYVAYGSKESEMPVIGDNLRALHEKLDAINDGTITVHVFDGGHDRACWKQAFATALTALLNR